MPVIRDVCRANYNPWTALVWLALCLVSCNSNSIETISLEGSAAAQSPPSAETVARPLHARAIELPDRTSHESLTVAVISDLNASYGSRWYPEPVHRAVERLVELKPDLVISAGDMVAGQQAGLDYPGMWNAFHETVSDPLFDAGIALAPSPGNHDASGYPQYANERGWYQWAWRWRKPDLNFVDDEHFPFRYAFQKDDVLFVALDATVARPLPDEQRRWLETVLTEHSDVRATIVYGHLPIYPFAQGRRWDTLDDPALEQLLNDHDVDLYVSGHHQAYYSGRRGTLRMVSTGCLGNGVRKLLGQARDSFRTIVLLHIHSDGDIQVEALTGDDFTQTVNLAQLPASVGDGHRVIYREDAAYANTDNERVDIGQLEQELRDRIYRSANANR